MLYNHTNIISHALLYACYTTILISSVKVYSNHSVTNFSANVRAVINPNDFFSCALIISPNTACVCTRYSHFTTPMYSIVARPVNHSGECQTQSILSIYVHIRWWWKRLYTSTCMWLSPVPASDIWIGLLIGNRKIIVFLDAVEKCRWYDVSWYIVSGGRAWWQCCVHQGWVRERGVNKYNCIGCDNLIGCVGWVCIVCGVVCGCEQGYYSVINCTN